MHEEIKNAKEIARTQFAVDQLIANNLIYTGFTIPEENHGVDDAWIISNNHNAFPLENKSILGNFRFKEEGEDEFRDYFKEELPNKMRLDCDIPKGTPVYFINAEAYSGPSKWEKVNISGACLSILAADGIVLYSPRTLKEAFLGYGSAFVTHRTEIGNKGKKRWEKKALLDLSKGVFIPCNTPKELIIKEDN